jgi:hypothetical protein
MDSTNIKTILDKTFMLLEQAINEKKAEQAAAGPGKESYQANKELSAKAGKPLSPNE